MLQKNKEKIVIISSLLIIIVNLITFPKKKISYNSQIESTIAKAIVILEQDKVIEKTVDRTVFPIEYNFSIKNFNDKDNINEVDFDYKIKIEASVPNFPVKYKLIDDDTNIEVPLNNNETSILSLGKYKKEIKHFKLYAEWNDLDVELADEVEIRLKIEAVQSKENMKNEE